MYILGIESSCDETAAAVVLDGRIVASNVVASQVDLHAQYGGVYPEVASRAHVEAISTVVEQALGDARVTLDRIDAVAVTRGPGLVGSLLVGINFAKGLALAANKPLIGVNHLEGHIYSLWLTEPYREVTFPVLVLIVSGGHTSLILMTDHGQYQPLGATLDDAAGEAFDKVGRLLRLPFPGGPHIERAAADGNAMAFEFPRAKTDGDYDFSFSGLKTAVLRAATVPPSQVKRDKEGDRAGDRQPMLRTDISVPDLAASFQRAAVNTLVEKTAKAAKDFKVTEIMLAGGVSANQLLRQTMRAKTDLFVRYPPLSLCTDNAAMIAGAAFYRLQLAGGDLSAFADAWSMDVRPTWMVGEL
jgi:N6-L-threonylcarbamoyladenine synthase